LWQVPKWSTSARRIQSQRNAVISARQPTVSCSIEMRHGHVKTYI
jgi:hypothetical protein